MSRNFFWITLKVKKYLNHLNFNCSICELLFHATGAQIIKYLFYTVKMLSISERFGNTKIDFSQNCVGVKYLSQ